MKAPRSHCPMNLAVEIFGDKWSLLIIRDIIIEGKRHFRNFLVSDEKISTNILTDRLLMLEKNGILTKSADPSHKQKKIYSLTQMGIELLPVLISIAKWSCNFLPVNEKSAAHAKMLIEGGKVLEEKMMNELKQDHLNII